MPWQDSDAIIARIVIGKEKLVHFGHFRQKKLVHPLKCRIYPLLSSTLSILQAKIRAGFLFSIAGFWFKFAETAVMVYWLPGPDYRLLILAAQLRKMLEQSAGFTLQNDKTVAAIAIQLYIDVYLQNF